MVSLFDHARDLVDVPNEVAVFHDRQGHAEEIGLLERAAADHFLRHLAGNGDDRNRIHEGIGQAGDKIGCAGAGGGHAEAHFSGSARVAFGRKNAALFMAGKDCADLFGARKCLMDRHARPAGISENGVGTLELETADKELGSVQKLGALLGRGGSAGIGGGDTHYALIAECALLRNLWSRASTEMSGRVNQKPCRKFIGGP